MLSRLAATWVQKQFEFEPFNLSSVPWPWCCISTMYLVRTKGREGASLSSDAGLSYTLTDPTHDKCWIRWLMGAKEPKDSTIREIINAVEQKSFYFTKILFNMYILETCRISKFLFSFWSQIYALTDYGH